MKLPFDNRSRKEYYALLDSMFDSNFWSDGPLTRRFEENFALFTGMSHASAFSSGGMALNGMLEFAGVADKEVIVPTNTFMATPLAVKRAGGKVVFADCSKDDLCLTLSEVRRLATEKTAAVIVVHIGGHIAFEIEGIADFCKEKGIALIEDCAHAHGATFNGKQAGSWGIGGAYSFYATKTMPTGEGGMVVTNTEELDEWLKLWRNYGKKVVNKNGKNEISYPLKNGFHARMPEMTAALGIVQLKNLPDVIGWKRKLARKYDDIFETRVKFPEGMESSYYKYIVLNSSVKEITGPVFGELCHWFLNPDCELPDSEWVAKNHACPPIFYGWDGFNLSIEDLKKRLL